MPRDSEDERRPFSPSPPQIMTTCALPLRFACG